MPLIRRVYCDAGRLFVHYENRVYQSSNARLGEALDFSRFGDRPAVLLGLPNASEGTVGNKVPNIFRSHNTEEHQQSEDPQCTSPAVACVHNRVRLHTRVPQRQR